MNLPGLAVRPIFMKLVLNHVGSLRHLSPVDLCAFKHPYVISNHLMMMLMRYATTILHYSWHKSNWLAARKSMFLSIVPCVCYRIAWTWKLFYRDRNSDIPGTHPHYKDDTAYSPAANSGHVPLWERGTEMDWVRHFLVPVLFLSMGCLEILFWCGLILWSTMCQ